MDNLTSIIDPSNLDVSNLLKKGLNLGVGLFLDYKAKKICERILSAEFDTLLKQGYLSVVEEGSLDMTDKALTDQIGLTVYSDIRAFMKEYNFTEEEVRFVMKTRVKIRMNKKLQSWDKRVGTAWPMGAQLGKHLRQRASTALGTWYAPKGVGAKQSLNQAMAYMRNAEAALGDSNARDTPMTIVIRAIGLAQLCGIEEIGLVDIMEGLSMSPIFETIARYIVGGVRNQHPSQVYNLGLLIIGSSENVPRGFAIKAKSFIGKREVIGLYTGTGVTLNGITASLVTNDKVSMPKKDEAIWCMSGWAEALRRQTANSNKLLGTDIHGTQLERDSKTAVKLSLKRVDGILMVKIKQVGVLLATDKYWGGIIGSPCPCKVPDPRKILVSGSRLRNLKIDFKRYDPLSIGAVPRTTIFVFKTYGDAIAHFYGAHTLMSSYVRADTECLHCAVCRAAGAGCNVVLM